MGEGFAWPNVQVRGGRGRSDRRGTQCLAHDRPPFRLSQERQGSQAQGGVTPDQK